MDADPDDDDDDWPGFASCCAQAAYEGSRSTPFGLFSCKDPDPDGTIDVLVLFNNQPYPDDPLLRDREVEEIRRRLRDEGIGELALQPTQWAELRMGTALRWFSMSVMAWRTF